MKILVTCTGFPPAYLGGGPIRSIVAMLREADARHDIRVLTNNYDIGDKSPLVDASDQWKRFEGASVLYLDRGLRAWLRGIRRALEGGPDVVYINGLFNARFSITLQLLLTLRRRPTLVIAPRGELDPGALDIKSGKKKTYLRFAALMRLLDDAIWHASSDLEANNIKRAFPRANTVIIRENDTLLPRVALRPQLGAETTLKAAFISRLSPKKGLHVALEALQSVSSPIHFDIFGPAEDHDYVRACETLVERLPAHAKVTFHGPMAPDSVRDILTGYHITLFPTAAENFGHVIAESLSVGTPVMCPDTTPWSPRLCAGGGVVVPTREVADWAHHIEEYAGAGREKWFHNRLDAAAAFDEWRRESDEQHFFELLETSLLTQDALDSPKSKA